MPRTLLLALLLAACGSEPAPPPATPPPAHAPPSGYTLPAGQAADPGFVALDVDYSAAMPAGRAQQVPDSQLKTPPQKVADALRGAQDELDASRRELRSVYDAARAGGTGDVVLLQGVPGHAEGEGASASNMQIILTPDEPTAVTTHNVCSNLILSCAERAGSFDACVAGVPTCQSDEPWKQGEDCCPAACKTAYDGRRQGGQVFLEAFMQTFVRDWSCFPGMPAHPQVQP